MKKLSKQLKAIWLIISYRFKKKTTQNERIYKLKKAELI